MIQVCTFIVQKLYIMRKILTLFVPIFMCSFIGAQVGINTVSPNGATVLDISSNQKGILIPVLVIVTEILIWLITMRLQCLLQGL